jgi:hypothetical protein
MRDVVDLLAAAGKPRRSSVALAICVLAALCAAAAIFKNWHPILVTCWVQLAWAQTAVWLQTGRWLPRNEQWRMLNKTPAQIYQCAKNGGLPTSIPFSVPIASLIHRGSQLLVVLLLVEIVWLFAK